METVSAAADRTTVETQKRFSIFRSLQGSKHPRSRGIISRDFRFGPLTRASYPSPAVETTNLPTEQYLPAQAASAHVGSGDALADRFPVTRQQEIDDVMFPTQCAAHCMQGLSRLPTLPQVGPPLRR